MEERVKLTLAVFRWDRVPQLFFGSQGAKGRLVDKVPEEVCFPSKVLVCVVSKVEVKRQPAVDVLWVGHQRPVCVTLA